MHLGQSHQRYKLESESQLGSDVATKSGNNYVIVVKSEKELTQDNLETVAEAVKEQVK